MNRRSPFEFLTTKETAAILRLSPRTLEGKRRTGKGPAFTRMGNDQNSKVVYLCADIDLWLEDKRHTRVVPQVKRSQSICNQKSDPPCIATGISGEDDWIALWLAQAEASV